MFSLTLILDSKIDKTLSQDSSNKGLIQQIKNSGAKAPEKVVSYILNKYKLQYPHDIYVYNDLILIQEPGRDRVFLKE